MAGNNDNHSTTSTTMVKNSFNLPSFQRRLRHVNKMAVRNLQLPKNQTIDFSKLQVFFTLHKSNKEKAMYTSEKITGSLNPTWQSFDLQSCDPEFDAGLATKFVVIRIWVSYGQESKVKIEANVHLSGLVYFSDKLQVPGVNHQPNTLLFGMFAVYFIHCDNTCATGTRLEEWLPDKEIPREKLPVATFVDGSLIKPSYNTNALSRIHTIQRAIRQTQASVRRIHSHLEDRLMSSKENSEKQSEREVLLMKVRQLRHELLLQTQRRQSEQEELETLRSVHEVKVHSLKENGANLKNFGKEREKKGSLHIQSREMLVKENAQLLFRRKQILLEMVNLIYPITQDDKQNFYICNVKLPNAENYQGHDETRIAVALGFTCHLTQQVSHFMDLPLRYPMVHRGSRSTIIDHIHSKLSDRDREFPLYGKGKEKFQYNYAVFLLNKNISQLRFYCGLGTNDLRQTLPNLKSLFDHRLGAKSPEPEGSSGSTTPRPTSIEYLDGSFRPVSSTSDGSGGTMVDSGRGVESSGGYGGSQTEAAIRAAEEWAASVIVPDVEPPTWTTTRLSSGGQGSDRAAAVVEGVGFSSINGDMVGLNQTDVNQVIVKPLVMYPGQRHMQNGAPAHSDVVSGVSGLSKQTNGADTQQHSHGNLMRQCDDNNSCVAGCDQSSNNYITGSVKENDESTDSDDLFKPADGDPFFQVKKKQELDDINSALEGRDNGEMLSSQVREQVLANGLLMDVSGLPDLSIRSPDAAATNRTFKLVKSAPVNSLDSCESPSSTASNSTKNNHQSHIGQESSSSQSQSSSESQSSSSTTGISSGSDNAVNDSPDGQNGVSANSSTQSGGDPPSTH